MQLENLSKLFKINDKPVELSPTQQAIFRTILTRRFQRNIAILPTQYGKSMTVALAVIICVVSLPFKWIIAAPSEKKARIIMGYIIDHLFDSPFFYSQLDIDDPLDRLKRERSKSRLTFKGGGEVMTLTLDARNGKRSMEAAMGMGAPNVILDESSLIDDPLYSSVKRMLGGHKDNFLFEIGNPFYRNHFYRSWNDKSYNRIFADYNTALSEGRFSNDFIDEMRQEANFGVYYECKFPSEDEVDSQGYRNLITFEELNIVDIKDSMAIIDDIQKDANEGKEEVKLGVDVGGGGDYNTYVCRTHDFSWVEGYNRSNDTMTNVVEVEKIKKKFNIKDNDIFIDDVGIGRGVTDRLKEKGIIVNAVSVGSSPSDKTKYKNIKAENSWEARMWLKENGNLAYSKFWEQITWIKYKEDSDKVLKIEPKDDLKRRKGKSPDFYEGFMLTFTKKKELQLFIL